MFSLLNILQLELHIFPVAVLLILLLPLSSNNRLRFYGCYTVYIFLVSCAAVLLLPIFLFRPKNVKNCVLSGNLLKHISKLVGIKWELRNGDILQVERGAVIVANHQSMFDVLGMFDFWHVMGKCAAISRKEVFYVWPFGLAAWAAGVVFIDRNRGQKANNQLDEASILMKKYKTKIWMFPEGTRNKKGDTLLDFKKGAFRIAVTSQVPIIPVVYSPYYFIDSARKHFGQGRIVVQVLDPISTLGKTENDIEALMKETRQVMVKHYDLLKEEITSTNNNFLETKSQTK